MARSKPAFTPDRETVEENARRERPAIRIYDAPHNVDALVALISKIGYRAIPHAPRHGGRSTRAQRFSAAIITDETELPFRHASEMSIECPVLFITSDTSLEARLVAARAGVSAVLARPLDVSELADWLNDLVGPHRETPLSILIVDDDEILAATYAAAIEDAGMGALVETNPSIALGRITATYPDLVLMDIHMPGLNGIELASIIRQSRRHLSLPIVFLSADRRPDRQLQARKLGGDDFICKPVDPKRLVSLVQMRADRAIRLRSIMERDSLTGLLNHGRFVDRIYHELERCQRSGNEVSLALIDLDHFKRVNDMYGHLCGDLVLRTLAQSLSGGLRRIDIIGRYGGEEFGILLLDTPPDAACVVVEKIRRRFSEIKFSEGDHVFSVTFSAGVSGSRRHLTPADIISAADELMYRAKADGRNQVLADAMPLVPEVASAG
jgi:diguanylate cyclase (GGDEF)-like protein